MQYPKIELKFDKKLDQDMAWQFYNSSQIGGVDFWKERANKHFSELSEIGKKKNKKQYLDNYIIFYYKDNKKEIEKLSVEINNNLREKELQFFKQVDIIFKKYPWPQKNIIGNFSIFNFCPRFLEDNEFQVFLYDDKKHQLFTIFHECLHFIFYDFAKKKFPEKLGETNTERGLFWDIAEIFNVVIQNTKEFKLIHGEISDICYPEHKELIKKGSNVWEKQKDVYKWIEEMLKKE